MAEEALAKARAIAARLSGGISGSDLGKRKNRWDEDQGSTGFAGLGAIKKKKVYIPVKEHPEVNFLGLLIGPRGSTQKQLQELSGAKIIIRGKGSQKDGAIPTGHPDDEDLLHVSIEGTDEAIEKAYKEVQQILYNPEQALRLKQEQLRSLAEMNGGATLIESQSIYSAGKIGEVGDGTDSYQVELRVPNNMVGLVIGKGGENIHRMQSQTGAHMQIAKESDMKPGETVRSIILKGTASTVADLKKRVEEVINNRVLVPGGLAMLGAAGSSLKLSSTTMRELEHAYVIKIPVPNDKVGVVIGKGGMTIKSIQERTGATVQIPPVADEDNPQIRTLSIGADHKEAVDAAQMEIFMALQMQQQQAQQALSSASNAVYIAVPDDKVGLIIGKGGVTIKDIQARTHVKIQIPQAADPGTVPPVRTCSIIGTPDAQHSARYEIEMVLQGQVQSVSTAAGQAMLAMHSYSQQQTSQMSQWGGAVPYPAATMTPYYAMMQSHLYGQYGVPVAAAAAAPGAGAFDMNQAYYGAAYSQSQGGAAAQAKAADGAAGAATDLSPTAYYNDFWQYASFYGEAAARVFYGAWSPPEGSQPPAAAEGAAAKTENADTAAGGSDAKKDDTGASGKGHGSESRSGQEAAKEKAGDGMEESSWETYKKQYSEWYEAYGRAAGADPHPPQPL